MLTNGVWCFEWDAENRLVAARNGAVEVMYAYDHKGRMWRRAVSDFDSGTSSYIIKSESVFGYDGWNPVVEYMVNYATGQWLESLNTWGTDLSGTPQGAGGVGGLLAVTTVSSQSAQPATYYPCYDANGNVTAYLDPTGGVAVAWAYDAFGRTVSETWNVVPETCNLPYRFSTKYLDPETGLYYYGYRFYHPELGRWVNRDPIGEAVHLNISASCENDLISRFDTLGLFSDVPLGYLDGGYNLGNATAILIGYLRVKYWHDDPWAFRFLHNYLYGWGNPIRLSKKEVQLLNGNIIEKIYDFHHETESRDFFRTPRTIGLRTSPTVFKTEGLGYGNLTLGSFSIDYFGVVDKKCTFTGKFKLKDRFDFNWFGAQRGLPAELQLILFTLVTNGRSFEIDSEWIDVTQTYKEGTAKW
jgi:RHS repeat-associated protein